MKENEKRYLLEFFDNHPPTCYYKYKVINFAYSEVYENHIAYFVSILNHFVR